jgi:hypothetical protein
VASFCGVAELSKKHQGDPNHGKQPEAHCDIRFPPFYPVRIEPTSKDEERYAAEQIYKGQQLGVSKRLNKVTAVAAFVGFLGLIFLYWQISIMRRQLDEARQATLIDQRAWVQMSLNIPAEKTARTPAEMAKRLTALADVTFPMKITNVGKTPALSTRVDVNVEILKKTEAPSFKYTNEHRVVTFGVLFPNGSEEFTADLLKPDGSVEQLSESERQGLSKGDSYVAVYAKATYVDGFGIHHCTQLCWWTAFIKGGSFNAPTCTAYNSTDRNKL